MKSDKMLSLLLALSVVPLLGGRVPLRADAPKTLSGYEKKLQDLSNLEKTEASKIETQIAAINAKYDPMVKALQQQLNSQTDKLKAEVAPLENQLRQIHDKFTAQKSPIEQVVALKAQLK